MTPRGAASLWTGCSFTFDLGRELFFLGVKSSSTWSRSRRDNDDVADDALERALADRSTGGDDGGSELRLTIDLFGESRSYTRAEDELEAMAGRGLDKTGSTGCRSGTTGEGMFDKVL